MEADEGPLCFQVQGSALNPYDLTFWGSGSRLKVYCSCPAGRKRLQMCKHAAALLMGDITALVDGLDHVQTLAMRSVDSPAVKAALIHSPQPPRERYSIAGDPPYDLSQCLTILCLEIAALGFVVEADADQIEVFELTPKGRKRLHPTLWLRVDERDLKFYHVHAPGHGSRHADLGRAAHILKDRTIALHTKR